MKTCFESADILAWRDFIEGATEDPPVKAAGLIFLYCRDCRGPAQYSTRSVSRLHRLARRDGWVIIGTHPRHANTTVGVCVDCTGYTLWRSLLSDDDSDGEL